MESVPSLIMKLTSCILSLSLLLSGSVFSKEEQPVHIQLICETDGITPGQPFNLGLFLRHDPGWHTYWKNPGDVGLAPKIEWKGLPNGFQSKPVIWASPQLHKMGVIDVQAYHGEILHIHPMVAPKDLKIGAKVTLQGQLSWLMCSRKCIPAWEKVTITLPVVAKSKVTPKWKTKFQQTRNEQPKALQRSLTATTHGNTVELTIQPPLPSPAPKPRELWFFCNENHLTTQTLPTIINQQNSTILKMEKTDWAPNNIPRLQGHLYFKKGWDNAGKIHNLLVDIPLD